MRQQTLEQTELGGLPAAVAKGASDGPDDSLAVRRVEACAQAVLIAEAEQALVVHQRRLPLVFGIKVAHFAQLAVWKPQDAGYSFVVREVLVEVFAPQVIATVTTAEPAGEINARVVVRPFADAQDIPVGADGFLDQGRGGGPVGVVEGRPVQRLEAALEGIVGVHAASSRWRVRACGNAPLKRKRGSSSLLFIGPSPAVHSRVGLAHPAILAKQADRPETAPQGRRVPSPTRRQRTRTNPVRGRFHSA